MAPSAKRARPLPKATAKSRKRQRLEHPNFPKQRHKVRLDDLQWKTVEMPDRLEDYEGFYGLEEIDDVDVVRDEATGRVSFEKSKPEKKLATPPEEDDNREEKKEEVEESDGSAWEGFSDEEENTHGLEAQEDPPSTLEKPMNISNKDDKDIEKKDKKSKKRKLEEDGGLENGHDLGGKGAFDILADQPVDENDAIEVDVSAWQKLGLSRDTLASLSRLKFSDPTPIQSATIPEILAGHDVIGKASTGSGKTLAFGIPILESFLASSLNKIDEKAPLALIISPTRELAHQITAHLTALASDGDFKAPWIATITGGLSFQKQQRLLENADIIVGTPGRLWEVFSSGHGLLSSVKRIRFLVLDEADRLLGEGQYKELGEILNLFDRQDGAVEEVVLENEASEEASVNRQTLVFSATFHKGLQQKLAGKGKRGGGLMSKKESMEYLLKKLNFREEKPKFIDTNPASQMASGLKEGLIECAGTEKDLYLYSILLLHPKKRTLVFTNSISAVRRVTPFLQNLDLPVLPLHSQMPQKARLRSVERFTERPGSILVATDVAARGLDIPGVQIIVHYHLPRAADMYVHRSGRTARGEATGSSILICAPEEVAGVRRLVAKVHAQQEKDDSAHYIRTLDIDRRVVSRLKPRTTLAKKIADAANAKEKKSSQDDLFKEAAEDLGVDYDSETLEAETKGRKGRGSARKKKEKEGRHMSKDEMRALRAELKGLLSQRVNTGVSARYLTGGGINVDSLLRGEGNAEFLGNVEDLGLDGDL